VKRTRTEQLQLVLNSDANHDRASPSGIAKLFDPLRLTQARQLAGLTKKELAEAVGVTPAAIGQYEAGTNGVRPLLIPKLAEALDVPATFFRAGRAHGKLDASMAHFRSLRSTRTWQRSKATSFVEQVWELANALERWVQLPFVDVPGFSGGELNSNDGLSRDPALAARELRLRWGLGAGPVSHLVRRLEAKGVVIVFPPRDEDMTTVDAFSTSRLLRPVIVLTANRADDIYRHRFTTAHELGHLILHGDVASGDLQQEREADAFAAEFLTPRESIAKELPLRVDFAKLLRLQITWGVSVRSLLYRCRELGMISESSATRAYKRLHALQTRPGFLGESASRFPGEMPTMLSRSFELASKSGLTVGTLAEELDWRPARVRELLGDVEKRPELRIVPTDD
jgi:Zn-dependent peptidase ImmA (M78 family)/transcriptional regulator with XRE-family HTH domain